jgi:hypothetical protein
MRVAREPDQAPRGDDEQALEEIRRLFARYRQVARHGIVTEHDQTPRPPAEEPAEAPAPTGR